MSDSSPHPPEGDPRHDPGQSPGSGAHRPIATLTLNPAVDQSTTVDHVSPEEKLRCDRPRFDPGGGGINVSRAVRRMGGAARAVYLAGGPGGEILEELLEGEGVEHLVVEIEGRTRQNLAVLDDSSDDQYRFTFPGPDVTEDEWRRCLEVLEELEPVPSYLVASGSLPPGLPADTLGELARRCRGRGVRLVVDSSGEPLCRAVEEGVFLVKPNLRELGQIVGRELEHDRMIEAAARKLVDDGRCRAVVVSLGAGGALLVTGEESSLRVNPPTVPIRSRVGAGDSMVGGLVLALARGLEMDEAVRYGVAAGAAAVTTPGTELCRGEDVERLFGEMSEQADR